MPCDSPVWINVKGTQTPVPCGKCPPCKIRRVNEWVFRIMWEEEHNSTSSHFVTLTYDSLHVPLTKNGFMTLRKKHFQDYMKRLRKLCDQPLKYYACGEYGDTYSRPHYHAIVLNCPDEEYFAKAWSLNGVQFGSVYVGTCTGDSVAYCLKYIDKESFRRKKYRHDRDDREKEFPLMSKGIGAGYCENPAVVAYHRQDLNRNYLTKLSGHRVPMPRYYRQRIFTADDLETQRDIISTAVELSDQRARLEHYASNRPYSYVDHLESEREGRRIKFKVGQGKRKSF